MYRGGVHAIVIALHRKQCGWMFVNLRNDCRDWVKKKCFFANGQFAIETKFQSRQDDQNLSTQLERVS